METFDLIKDPEAPYGRFDDGSPMSKVDYDRRYVFENGWDNYPPNNGATHGTRIFYDDFPAMQRDYGVTVDRIGGDGGDYLGVRVDDVNASFEQRALPISALEKPLSNYELTGALPEGWRIELSEIAPGFGREGGGLQIRFIDEVGDPVPVHVLKDEGLLS